VSKREQLINQAAASAARLEWSAAADLLTDAGDSTSVLDRRGWYLSRAKRYTEARAIFEELAKREPRQFRHFYMAASQYYEAGEFEPALALFEQAIGLNPTHLKSWWRKSHSLHKLQREDEAAPAAARVLQIWHESDATLKERGRDVAAKASHLLARWELHRNAWAAVDLAQQAVQLDGRDPYHRYVFAMALLHTKRASEAIVEFREARRIKPGDLSIEVGLADAYVRTGDTQGAIAILRRTEPRLIAGHAFRAARLLHAVGEEILAARLADRARRDRKLKDNERLKALLEEIRATIVSGNPQVNVVGSSATEMAVGHVVVVRQDRGFGFLIDESDGVRRHFRLGGSNVRVGDRVRFHALEADKGPAASDVQPLAEEAVHAILHPVAS
jgi:tetratricopeptide (TPR) repeat protein/cold shock CspA family protein